jgi:hypothetical protein
LIEQEGNLCRVDLLHGPAVAFLQALIIP